MKRTTLISLEQPQVYSNVIPRRRTKTGDPVPRRIVHLRPLMTLDREAIRGLLEQGGLGDGNLPALARVKLASAVAAAENARIVKEELLAKKTAEREQIEAQLRHLESQLTSIRGQIASDEHHLAALTAGFGLKSLDRENLSFASDEPVSLDVLAGRHGLPMTGSGSSMLSSGYKLLAGIGGGIVFGVSLGLMTGKLELASLDDELPWLILWSSIGITVMTLVGSCLYPLAQSLGQSLFVLQVKQPDMVKIVAVAQALVLAALTLGFLRIESLIESIGLLRGIMEQNILAAFHLTASDSAWASLMLALPTIGSYVILGCRDGHRRATLAHLLSMRQDCITSIIESEQFSRAAALHRRVQRSRDQQARVVDRLTELHGQLRTEFTEEELYRLEDMEMDAAAASWEAEDVLFSMVPGLKRNRGVKSRSLCSRITRLFCGRGT